MIWTGNIPGNCTTSLQWTESTLTSHSGNGDDYKQPGTTNADKIWEIDAYPELVTELRTALGPTKTLCAALPGVPRDMMAFSAENLAKIVPHMDFFNILRPHQPPRSNLQAPRWYRRLARRSEPVSAQWDAPREDHSRVRILPQMVQGASDQG